MSASLFDLLENPEELLEQLNAMGLDGTFVKLIEDFKNGICGMGMEVEVDGEVEGEHPHHPHPHPHVHKPTIECENKFGDLHFHIHFHESNHSGRRKHHHKKHRRHGKGRRNGRGRNRRQNRKPRSGAADVTQAYPRRKK